MQSFYLKFLRFRVIGYAVIDSLIIQPAVISVAMLKRSISRKKSYLSASQVVSQTFYDRTTKIGGLTVHHKLQWKS